MLAFFRRRVASAELALDLTAETFAAALEASPRYELRPEPARNWPALELTEVSRGLRAMRSELEVPDGA